jgi:thiamine pyrophosphokinase
MRAILLGPIALSSKKQRAWFRQWKVSTSDLLVGVDGGLDIWNRYGYQPHWGVGDWDSLENKGLLKKVLRVDLQRDKDRSDLFYAVLLALSQGARRLLCVGFTGGRLDHHLATLCDLAWFSDDPRWIAPIEVFGVDGGTVFLSQYQSSWRRKLPLKTLVSIFGFPEGASGVDLTGFRYELKNALLLPSSLGLSNEVLSEQVEVRLKRGHLLVLIPERNVWR